MEKDFEKTVREFKMFFFVSKHFFKVSEGSETLCKRFFTYHNILIACGNVFLYFLKALKPQGNVFLYFQELLIPCENVFCPKNSYISL